MKFKYKKDELEKICESQELFDKSIDESMFLVLKSFEEHKIFPPINFMIQNCDARYLPFLFRNYILNNNELNNIKKQSLTYKAFKNINSTDQEIKKDLEISSLLIKDIFQHNDKLEDFSHNINEITQHSMVDILSVKQIKNLAISNQPIHYKKEYDIKLLEEIAEDSDFHKQNLRNYNSKDFYFFKDFVVKVVSNSTLEEFDSISPQLIDLIDGFLSKNRTYNDNLSKLIKRDSYIKNKYLSSSYSIRSVIFQDIKGLNHKDIYSIFEKTYNNELLHSQRIKENNSDYRKYLFSELYNKEEIFFIKENLDFIKISEICDNRIVFLWEEKDVINNKEIFIKESVMFDSNRDRLRLKESYWKDLNPKYFDLIIDENFYKNIISNLPQGQKKILWDFSNLIEVNVLKAASKIIYNGIPEKLNIKNTEENDKIEQTIININNFLESINNDLSPMKTKIAQQFRISILENKPVIYNFEIGHDFFCEIKDIFSTCYKHLEDMSIHTTFDKVLLLDVAQESDLFTKGVKNLNPEDVMALRAMQLSIPDEIIGNPLARPADSSTAFHFRKNNLFNIHLVGYFFDVPGHYEKIKDSSDFNLSLEDCFKLLSMENTVSNKTFIKLVDWVSYSFEKNPPNIDEMEGKDVFNTINSFPKLRKFIKKNAYSYKDFLDLNLKASIIEKEISSKEIDIHMKDIFLNRFNNLKEKTESIPLDIQESFIDKYLSEKGWEKHGLPLVNQSLLQSKYFNIEGCKFDQFNLNKEYCLDFTFSSEQVSPLTKEQINFVVNVMEDSLIYGAYVDLFYFDKLMKINQNVELFANRIKEISSILYLSETIRSYVRNSENDFIFTEDEEVEIYKKSIKKIECESIKNLFRINKIASTDSTNKRQYSENFWNELTSEEFTFKEKLLLSFALIDEDTDFLNNDQDYFKKILKRNLNSANSIHMEPINPIFRKLIKDESYNVINSANNHIIFPDLYNLEKIKANFLFMSQLKECYDLNFSGFNLHIQEYPSASTKKAGTIDILRFENTINRIINLEKIKSFKEDIILSLNLFIESDLSVNSAVEYIKLKDSNLPNFMELMKHFQKKFPYSSDKDRAFSCLKNLTIDAIMGDEITQENKNFIIDIAQGMKLSNNILKSSFASFGNNIEKVLLSPEVLSTIEIYVLNKKIYNQFNNFNLHNLEDSLEKVYKI